MRRADRLFLLIQALRGRRTAITARNLAERLQVSLRTVYRDVADLQRAGVPVEGAAGVGYLLRRDSDIPPLMFNAEELEALMVGARMVRGFAGGRLAGAADRALLRIEGVLPPELRGRAERTPVFAPDFCARKTVFAHMDRLHQALAERRCVVFDYSDVEGRESRREVEPLCLVFWGPDWTLGAWCLLRQDFRSFRLDRMRALALSERDVSGNPARGLEAYIAAVSRE
jgi:predicted DNA-binding transcriptional regulator YafY